MRAAFLSVWAVMLSVAFLQAAHGLQTDLIGVRAGLEGFSDRTIGFLMAAYYVGYSSGPFAGHAVVGRLGHSLTIAVCVLIAAAMIVCHALIVTPAAWGLFRFASGVALSLAYVSFESWINDRVANVLRGRVFSLYIVTQMTAMTLAQYLFGLADPHLTGPFFFSALLFTLAAVPATLGRKTAPAGAPPVPINVLRLLRASPLGATGALLAGSIWAMLATMGPVYAAHAGFDLKGIALWMGVIMAAGTVSQFPLGWLSDFAGRRRVMAGMYAGGFAAAVAGFLSHGTAWQYAVAALAGLTTFPLYTVAVSHVNDPIARADRVAAAAGLVFLFGLGSIFGALGCGWAMGALGPRGFYAALAVLTAAGLGLAARFR